MCAWEGLMGIVCPLDPGAQQCSSQVGLLCPSIHSYAWTAMLFQVDNLLQYQLNNACSTTKATATSNIYYKVACIWFSPTDTKHSKNRQGEMGDVVRTTGVFHFESSKGKR